MNKQESLKHIGSVGQIDGLVTTCGLKNIGRPYGDMGAYITYDKSTLSDFLIWKMLGESDYVVGLEPRTTSLGVENIANNDKYVVLKPFEEYKTSLKFRFEMLGEK